MTVRLMNRLMPAAAWRICIPMVLLALLNYQVPATAEEAVPYDQYRVLEWDDLVPAGWESPLVSKAYDEISSAEVDEASLVQELDGQLAAIPGYMKPIVYEGNEVTEFLLVPFMPHQVRAHAHVDANQMIYVYTLEPVVVEKPFEPIWVVGAMSLEPVMTDEGPAGYRMLEAVTTEYEY